MSSAVHYRYEILRTLRNRRFFAITLALPLVIFYAIASANRHAHTDGIAFPLYFMTGMAAYGAMFAAVSPGARIAADRARGWTRQLRITPLRPHTYLISKVLSAYLTAVPALLLLFLAGTTLGVRLEATHWLAMAGLLLVGLAPFVELGLIVGNLAQVDSIAPIVGGIVVLFALLGGVFGQIFNGGTMLTFVKLLPSYWLVQAGKAADGGGDWPLEGWIVVAVWAVALIPVGVFAFRRSVSRA
jgi:ABC-2 type transport system permease protein